MKSKIITVIFISITALIIGAIFLPKKNQPLVSGPVFYFESSNNSGFTEGQKSRIQDVSRATVRKMQELYPRLSKNINFNIRLIDRDLSVVNGVTGRADRANEIEISLSSIYPGGVDQAINDGLEITLFHELHHVVRGWLIHDNKFGQGIDIAAINEGLADVFAEAQTGRKAADFPGNPDFNAWTTEILGLPKDANYGEWMNQLPDGRVAVGYRTGGWLVKKAIQNSGLSILELSELPISEIYRHAGFSPQSE